MTVGALMDMLKNVDPKMLVVADIKTKGGAVRGMQITPEKKPKVLLK